jgi:hypothetical protein
MGVCAGLGLRSGLGVGRTSVRERVTVRAVFCINCYDNMTSHLVIWKLTFLLEWFFTCSSTHALSPATTTPPTTFPCTQIFPCSPTTTPSGSSLRNSSPQLSTISTSFLQVTSTFSPFQNTLALARSSYLIVARSAPKLIDEGEEAGVGIRKRKVEMPRRAW